MKLQIGTVYQNKHISLTLYGHGIGGFSLNWQFVSDAEDQLCLKFRGGFAHDHIHFGGGRIIK